VPGIALATQTVVSPPAAATASRVAPGPTLRVVAPARNAIASRGPVRTNNVKIIVPWQTAVARASGFRPVNAPARNAIASRGVPTISHVDNEVRIIVPPRGATATALSGEPAFGASATLVSDFTGADEDPISEGGNWDKMDSNFFLSLKRVGNKLAAPNTSQWWIYYTAAMYGPDVDVYATLDTRDVDGRRFTVLARVAGAGGANTFDGYEAEGRLLSGTDSWKLFEIRDFGSVSYAQIAGGSREWSAGEKIGLRCRGNKISLWIYSGGSWSKISEVTDSVHSAAGRIGVSMSGTLGRLDDVYAGTLIQYPRVVIS
jgi:hypothetical protein